MQTPPRKTKIVCTLGPATSSQDHIRELMDSGMDVARLNFSHGDHTTHLETIRIIRRLRVELKKPVGILQDLGGPKIRLGILPDGERLIQTGDTVSFCSSEESTPSDIPVNYPYLVEDVKIGDRILISDGLVLLNVIEKEMHRVICMVLVGGVIHSHKGMNLPSSRLRVSSFTDKDRTDLAFGLEQRVDFVALSFVRHEDDLKPVIEMLSQSRNRPFLIAKIEKPQAIERIHEILALVDGVMVARGDLGVEMPFEEVPMIQKKIIRLARQAAKPVITATQMLRSMINSPRPTRAEATDVANAILDGTDALMLSEETAMGAYPIEAVRVLGRISRATEAHLNEQYFAYKNTLEPSSTTASAIGRSACLMADDLKAAAIVAGTSSGSTARLVAMYRPSCPVIGLTPDDKTERQLNLSWGVVPGLVAPFSNTDEIFDLARSWALAHDFVHSGDRMIVTAGVPVGKPGTTNVLRAMDVE
jgi:pyruvate kinase